MPRQILLSNPWGSPDKSSLEHHFGVNLQKDLLGIRSISSGHHRPFSTQTGLLQRQHHRCHFFIRDQQVGSSGIVKIHQLVRYGFEPTNRGVSQVQAALTAARLTEDRLIGIILSDRERERGIQWLYTLGYQVQLCHVLSTEVWVAFHLRIWNDLDITY